jgi:TRAP-type transport system periplasmic protein
VRRAGLVAIVLVALAGAAAAAPVELRLSSLAPDRSMWARHLGKGAREIAAKTNGRVTLKFFFGGSQGGERDFVRKMRTGRLDGAAVTAVGLGDIRSDVRVLELPFLFRNDTELDYVRSTMKERFEREFDEAGYVLLGWGDLGWIHVFSNIPIVTRADFGKLRIWAWADDAVVRAFLKRLGMAGVPLDVPDVLPALQRGTIDSCYNSPIATLAFGWHTRVKYMTAEPIAFGVGAILLTKDAWSRVPVADQAMVRAVMRDVEGRISREMRATHLKAKKALGKAGVKTVKTPAPLLAELEKMSIASWGDLAGKLFAPELLREVRARIGEVRK